MVVFLIAKRSQPGNFTTMKSFGWCATHKHCGHQDLQGGDGPSYRREFLLQKTHSLCLVAKKSTKNCIIFFRGKDSPIAFLGAKVTTPKRLFEGEVKVLDIGQFEAI